MTFNFWSLVHLSSRINKGLILRCLSYDWARSMRKELSKWSREDRFKDYHILREVGNNKLVSNTHHTINDEESKNHFTCNFTHSCKCSAKWWLTRFCLPTGEAWSKGVSCKLPSSLFPGGDWTANWKWYATTFHAWYFQQTKIHWELWTAWRDLQSRVDLCTVDRCR